MATNRTFTMIKPDAVADGNSGAIIKMIEEAGFKVIAMKKTLLTPAQAGKFYEVHAERPFYADLCEYMSSGPIVPMILEKENAVEKYKGFLKSGGSDYPINILKNAGVDMTTDIPIESTIKRFNELLDMIDK